MLKGGAVRLAELQAAGNLECISGDTCWAWLRTSKKTQWEEGKPVQWHDAWEGLPRPCWVAQRLRSSCTAVTQCSSKQWGVDGTDLRSGYTEAFKIEHRGLAGCGRGWGVAFVHFLDQGGTPTPPASCTCTSSLAVELGQISNSQRV